MFGKKPPKCPTCGKRLSKHNVWNAKTGTFEVETACTLCPPTKERPKKAKKDQENNTTIHYKTNDELENEQRERQNERLEEDKIYEEFLKNEKIRLEQEQEAIKLGTKTEKQIVDDVNIDEPRDLFVDNSNIARDQMTCIACGVQVDFFSGKKCKYCNETCCFKHLLANRHDCIKDRYVKFIRKTWLRKMGQNITTGKYTVVCETCGYVSDFPALIEVAGYELESHLKNNELCMQNKRTFLEELVTEPIPQEKVRSSISTDLNRKFWVCAHCRPPRKFTDRDAYIAHHFTHN